MLFRSYHQYAADEHTLVCLAQVDRVAGSREDALGRYAEILQALERPSLLYLALLLHDSGKGDAHGDHAARGVINAQRVARRLRLDGSTTNRWWSYNNTYYPVGFIVNGVLAATNWSTALNLSAQEVVLAIDLASMAGNVVGNHYYEVRVTCTSGVKTGFVTFLT